MKSSDSGDILLFKHVDNIFCDFTSLNIFDGKALKFGDDRVAHFSDCDPPDLDNHRGTFNFAIVRCRGDLRMAFHSDKQFFDCAEFDTDPSLRTK
jgi:hypothetical protein